MPAGSPLARAVRVLLGFLLLAAAAGCAEQESRPADRAAEPSAASPAVPGRFARYVALGDSYTSAPLVPVTDVANGCFRSSGNYPTLVSAELGARLDDRSCGGARTVDLHRPQFPGVPAQLSGLDRRTDLVTLSIGGNDGGVFRRMIERCAGLGAQTSGNAPCRDRMTTGNGRDLLLDRVARARPKLLQAVRDIHRLAPNARVLMVGYPQIVDSRKTCDRLPLAPGDYPYVARVNRALDQNLRFAARRGGATYVDVWAASEGHGVCSDDPWVNGAESDRERAAAYHPFAVEQRTVARLVLEALS